MLVSRTNRLDTEPAAGKCHLGGHKKHSAMSSVYMAIFGRHPRKSLSSAIIVSTYKLLVEAEAFQKTGSFIHITHLIDAIFTEITFYLMLVDQILTLQECLQRAPVPDSRRSSSIPTSSLFAAPVEKSFS
jgi:hypothetical protein